VDDCGCAMPKLKEHPGQATVDLLSVLDLPMVAKRTGYSRRTIMRMLADDLKDKAPGRTFPAPLRARNGSNRLEWREGTLVEWLDNREQ
jgi:predicted DNA-binding transcriptional regulator AlpA